MKKISREAENLYLVNIPALTTRKLFEDRSNLRFSDRLRLAIAREINKRDKRALKKNPRKPHKAANKFTKRVAKFRTKRASTREKIRTVYLPFAVSMWIKNKWFEVGRYATEADAVQKAKALHANLPKYSYRVMRLK